MERAPFQLQTAYGELVDQLTAIDAERTIGHTGGAFVVEHPQPAAVVGGAGVLVNVPSAARFALHKLLVARARPAAFQTKAAKDLHQAAQLIAALAEDRPGDLRRAWRAVMRRKRTKRARDGIEALGRRHPEARAALEREMR